MEELIFKGGFSHRDGKQQMGGETAVESLDEDGGSWNGEEETFLWKRRWRRKPGVDPRGGPDFSSFLEGMLGAEHVLWRRG